MIKKDKITDLHLFYLTYKTKFFEDMSKKNISCTLFCSTHSKKLVSDLVKHKKEVKKYSITESTSRRIDNVPVGNNDFSSGFFKHLSNIDMEIGFVSLPKRLHFIYVIDGVSVKMLIFKGKRKSISDSPESMLSKACVGFIYIDLDDDECFINHYINNPLDVSRNQDNTLIGDECYLDALMKMKKSDSVLKNYRDDYDTKFNQVKKCLQSFVFMKFAKVYQETLISVDHKVSKKLKFTKSESEIIKIDSFWDKSIEVINPFGVTGHFRNQAYGEGRKKRKIYLY